VDYHALVAAARPLELAAMRSLAWPTETQTRAFVEHLCLAHSWYKHLPPTDDAAFVVFVAADAGVGFEHNIRYRWTPGDYRERFGWLDYAWRMPGESIWNRDGDDRLRQGAIEPTSALVQVAGFQLGPACSSDGATVEAIHALHAGDAALAPGYRDLCTMSATTMALWDELTDAERDAIVGDAVVAEPSPMAQRYFEAERRMWSQYNALHEAEVAKIGNAIERLRIALAG
jgi:hypothetical protein